MRRHELLAQTRELLRAAGIENWRGEAELLAREQFRRTAGMPRHWELVEEVDEAFRAGLRTLAERRARREPLQLVVGSAPFRGLELATSPGVFIPRPETEVVAGVAIDAARAALGEWGNAVVVDLCTGSGAIAAAVAAEVDGAEVWAVEIDAAAVELAGRNTAALGVSVVRGDAAHALPALAGAVDVVVSNPPYIPPDAVPRDPEVMDWDPPLALWGGGDDGLLVPAAVICSARRLLRDGGTLVMEHADTQGAAVRALVEQVGGFRAVRTMVDLTGRDRLVRATRARGVGDLGS